MGKGNAIVWSSDPCVSDPYVQTQSKRASFFNIFQPASQYFFWPSFCFSTSHWLLTTAIQFYFLTDCSQHNGIWSQLILSLFQFTYTDQPCIQNCTSFVQVNFAQLVIPNNHSDQLPYRYRLLLSTIPVFHLLFSVLSDLTLYPTSSYNPVPQCLLSFKPFLLLNPIYQLTQFKKCFAIATGSRVFTNNCF